MKLRKQDQEFRNPRIFYADPKNVDLDRVLVVLFLWLKTGGMRPATIGRQKKEFEKVGVHFNRLARLASAVSARTKTSPGCGSKPMYSTW